MAPFDLLNTKEGVKSKDTHTHKPANKKVYKVCKRSTFPSPSCYAAVAGGFPLSLLPAELQHKVWSEALHKPACHTFKILRSKDEDSPGPWELHLHPIPKKYDTSAYRRWKSLLYTKASGDTKLKNISFQTGFRHGMVDFRRIPVKTKGQYHPAAAIDAGTDLVILEFERGLTAPMLGWFQHSDPDVINLTAIRKRMRHFKRVAIHYRPSHPHARGSGGPFSCYCPSGLGLCGVWYRACVYELACFLDCFRNLEEFYLVTEMKNKPERDWAYRYEKMVRKMGYRVAKPEKLGGGTYELARYFGARREYIQHCPEAGYYEEQLDKKIGDSPLLDYGGPRELVVSVMKLYRGITYNETFRNNQEKRDKVKFGMLLEY